MVKFDPHHHQESFDKWKAAGMPLEGLNDVNREVLIQHILDMELGRNISIESKKGGRGPGTLRNRRSKLYSMFLLIQNEKGKNIPDLTELDILAFFNDMRKGVYKSPRTKRAYKSVGTYVKNFKAFWHWFIKYSKKQGKLVEDFTVDLDSKDEKPKFNYFTIEQLKILCDHSAFYYKVLMMFLFDSGIRAPTELQNVRVSDLEYDKEGRRYSLNIRDEVSKTFGRKIKLMLCSSILKQFIEQEKLVKDDFLFTKTPQKLNKYLSRAGYRILKIGEPTFSKKNKKEIAWFTDGLSLYDFRHSSACYWLPKYKSESALKYRFGWKKSDMIHYYTELLGMKDTIQDEDLYVDISKTDLEKQIIDLKRNIDIKDEVYSAKLEEMNNKFKELEDKYSSDKEEVLLKDKNFIKKIKAEVLKELNKI